MYPETDGFLPLHHYHPSLSHHHLSFSLLLCPPSKSLCYFPSTLLLHTPLLFGVRLRASWGHKIQLCPTFLSNSWRPYSISRGSPC